MPAINDVWSHSQKPMEALCQKKNKHTPFVMLKGGSMQFDFVFFGIALVITGKGILSMNNSALITIYYLTFN